MRKEARPNVFDPTAYGSYRLDLLVQYLYDFDCHERTYVLRDLTGECGISEAYKSRVTDLLKIPSCRVEFWGIDYLIDWLYAALLLSQIQPTGDVYDNAANVIRGNNEDVDILLALRAKDEIHLVMVEVKVEMPFSRSQLTSKVKRLGTLFGVDGKRYPHIHPYLLLASPYRSRRISTKHWPKWMTSVGGEYLWYEMRKNFHSMKITRCDSSGSPRKNGSAWILQGRKGVKLDVWLSSQERQAVLGSVYVPDDVKLLVSSCTSEQFVVRFHCSVPDLISIISAISEEAKAAERSDDDDSAEALWDLHDRLSTHLWDKGVIVSEDDD